MEQQARLTDGAGADRGGPKPRQFHPPRPTGEGLMAGDAILPLARHNVANLLAGEQVLHSLQRSGAWRQRRIQRVEHGRVVPQALEESVQKRGAVVVRVVLREGDHARIQRS